MTITDNWIKHNWDVIQNKCREEIFITDETGLFFKNSPRVTLKFKNEKCIGCNMSNQSVTVLGQGYREKRTAVDWHITETSLCQER